MEDNTLNISHEKNRKNLMKYLFYLNFGFLITSLFLMLNYKIIFIINLGVLGLQFLMDVIEPHVQGVLNKGGLTSRVNNFAGKR